jgi:hypothetical protein
VAPDGVPSERWLAKQVSRRARTSARAQQAHEKALRRREQARLEAREALPRHVVVGLAAGAASLPLDGGLGAVAAVVAGVCGLRAYRKVRTLRLPPLAPLALPAPVPPAVDRRSAAFPAVLRLERAHQELARLLPLVPEVGREVAGEAWRAAAEVDGALRWQAVRLSAVEPHRRLEPEALTGLSDGIASQERLVAAVADLVAASADPLATRRLQEATDAVHGLAAGLREVR